MAARQHLKVNHKHLLPVMSSCQSRLTNQIFQRMSDRRTMDLRGPECTTLERTTLESPNGDDSAESHVSHQGESTSRLTSHGRGLLTVSPSLSSSCCLILHLCCTSRLDFRQSSQQHCKPSRGHLSSALRYSQHLSQSRKTSPSHVLHVLPSGVQHPGGGQTGECPLVLDRCCSGEPPAREQTGFNLIVIFFLLLLISNKVMH